MNGSNETLFQPQLRLEAQGGSHFEIPQRSPTRILSSAQEHILRFDQSDPSRGLQTRIRMCGALNRSALRAALDRIVARHEVLRTRFEYADRQILQRVEPPDIGFPLEGHAQVPNASREAIWDIEAPVSFDFARGPLVRGHLVQAGECEHLLVIFLHASVADAWSVGVMIRELVALYNAFCVHAPDPLPPLDSKFSAFASLKLEQTSGEKRRWRQEYWVRVLADMPERLSLPVKPPRAATRSSAAGRVPVKLPAELYAHLQALAYRKEIPLFVPLLCGWAVLLGRWSGQEDVVIGTRMPNRASPEFERLIGPFENLIALRVRFRDDMTVGQLLKDVKTVVRRGQSHQDVSFEQVAEHLSLSSGCPPALQVLMNVNASPQDVSGYRELSMTGLEISDVSLERLNSPFDLSLSVDEGPDGITGALEYSEDLFEREMIERLLVGWQALLGELVMDVYQPVSRLPVMSEPEKSRVVVELNRTVVPYPMQMLIHQLFEEQADRTPDGVAAEHEGRRLTYTQLNRRANQLARYLLSQGVGSDQVVGICVERGLEMVVGLLAILKAGGAYLPLDPNYPQERLRQMLEDAAPAVVLSETELMGVLPSSQAKVIALDQKLGQIAGFIDENLPPAKLGLSSESLVYVIYTSGSTGRPKGTAMRHRSVVNLIEWHRRIFGEGQGRRVLQFAALSFDVAFQEIFSTLCTGGTLVLLDEWIRRDAKALTEFLIAGSVERLFAPPLILQSIAEHCKSADRVPVSLKDVITAGEQLRVSAEVQALFGRLEGCRLHNHYGPTETHVVTTLTLEGDSGAWPELPPIGRPIANTEIYVLDGQMQPVPIGVAGEIYIGGANVARGYLRRPELTDQRFVADPYSADPNARLYKTGDLGRWRADGVLEYIGRNDDQVKIRGFRVELGEIEAQLARHEQVREAAVVVREEAPGEKRLVAYVTTRGKSFPGIEDLRQSLQGALPDYMVPSAFVVLEKLPLTPSGKLDRRALPAPDLSAYVSREYEVPQGEVEEELAELWQELLRVKRVGRNDNFFELGGHSLLIVQMMERLRKVGRSTDVRRVYDSPTIAGLARTLRGETVERYDVPPNLIPPDCRAITADMLPLVELEPEHIEHIVRQTPGGVVNIQDIYPLTALQEGILFHHLMADHGHDTYVLPILLSISCQERVDQFVRALEEVIRRHAVLRTAVLWEQLPRPVQVVHRRVSLPVGQIALDPSRDVLEQFRQQMVSERERFDLRAAPLVRLQVAVDPKTGGSYVLLHLHHLLCDHQSLETMLAEVMDCVAGHAHELPAPVPYRNHVAQALAHARTHDAEAFFRDKLADVDEPTAPFELLDVHRDGSDTHVFTQALDPVLGERIRGQARTLGVSAATLFHAVWALVVSRTSRKDDVVYGTLLSGRLQGAAGAQRIIGMFINTLPLRLRLNGLTARELVDQTQRELMELLSHEQASLAVAQRCSGVTESKPLFNTLLNYLHGNENPQTEGIRVLEIKEWTNYPITVSVDDQPGGFTLKAHTDLAVDPQRVLGYVVTGMRSLLEALERTPDTLALTLPILPSRERLELIELFNRTDAAYPRERLVHELFEEQAARTPESTALECEGRSLTYSELNAQANRLARYLMQQGVGPDRPVGVCVERSPEMVIGLLAALKAGGAYVPLDPDYPSERLAYMLQDARPAVVLTQSHLTERLPPSAARVITFDGHEREMAAHSMSNPDPKALGLRSDHLAYVIYTSGSTGKPKGVMVEHRSVLSLWHGLEQLYRQSGPCKRVAVNASFNFDASVKQLIQLLSGRTLVLVPQQVRWDAGLWMKFIEESRIECTDCTPSQLKSWISAGFLEGNGGSLRMVLVGGEAIDPQLWSRLAQCTEIDFYNLYGPTESTVDATAALLKGDSTAPHIGRPMENRRVYLLDPNGQPVPVGVVGEIYIGGEGVARGYLNRPELTAERFLRDPFSADPHARLYKTGDLGRWRAEGILEYSGRNDDQVKIRGFRIELGEIEAQLARHEQVKEAAVVAREEVPGEKRLVAYVVPRGQSAPGVEELQAHLKAALPEFMVPAAFVVLERLPLTPSGKLDRRALPAPELSAFVAREYEPPQGEVEELLAGIWQQLLRVEPVGRNDNFFGLGGHSLSAMRMLTHLKSVFSLTVPIRLLFEHPTLSDLASQIETMRHARVREELSAGGRDVHHLLERVTAMSDTEVDKLIKELATGGLR